MFADPDRAPVLPFKNLKTGKAFKMPYVTGRYRHSVNQRRRGNQDISILNRRTFRRQIGLQLAKLAHDFNR